MLYHIVGHNNAIVRFFTEMDYKLSSAQKADILVFTGGADISSRLYNEKSIRVYEQNSLSQRDLEETAIYYRYPEKGKIGICRGAQLLFVLNGGTLWQDVDKHTTSHPIFLKGGQTYEVTSTHHQMMKDISNRHNPYTIRGWAFKSTLYSSEHTSRSYPRTLYGKTPRDLEIVWFEKTRSYCFQPHPELSLFKYCQDAEMNTGMLFVDEIETLFNKEKICAV